MCYSDVALMCLVQIWNTRALSVWGNCVATLCRSGPGSVVKMNVLGEGVMRSKRKERRRRLQPNVCRERQNKRDMKTVFVPLVAGQCVVCHQLS